MKLLKSLTDKFFDNRNSIQFLGGKIFTKAMRFFVRSRYDVFPDIGGMRWMLHLLYGPIAFQAVRSAFDLGILDLLKTNPNLTVEEITKRIGLKDPYTVRLLLRACVAARAIKKRGDVYSINFSVDIDKFRIYMNQAHTLMYRQLYYTKESIEQRKAVGLYEVYDIHDGEDFYAAKRRIPELHSAWDPVMTKHSKENRRHLLNKIDYSKYKHIMDVGCNDSELIIQILQRNPTMKATVVDLPDSPGLLNSKKNIAKHGLESRMVAIGLDAFNCSFPKGADLIEFVHFINMFSPERNKLLFKRVYDALELNGTLMVVGPVVNEDEKGFAMDEPVLYSLVFLVCRTGEGEIYSSKDIADMMSSAGFVNIKINQLNLLEAAITGEKK